MAADNAEMIGVAAAVTGSATAASAPTGAAAAPSAATGAAVTQEHGCCYEP